MADWSRDPCGSIVDLRTISVLKYFTKTNLRRNATGAVLSRWPARPAALGEPRWHDVAVHTEAVGPEQLQTHSPQTAEIFNHTPME